MKAQVQSYLPGGANVPSWEGTLAPPAEYNWTVNLRRQYGLMSNYFDHLFRLEKCAEKQLCDFQLCSIPATLCCLRLFFWVSVPMYFPFSAVNLPLHHKVHKFSSGTAHPDGPRKRAVKGLWWWWWCFYLECFSAPQDLWHWHLARYKLVYYYYYYLEPSVIQCRYCLYPPLYQFLTGFRLKACSYFTVCVWSHVIFIWLPQNYLFICWLVISVVQFLYVIFPDIPNFCIICHYCSIFVFFLVAYLVLPFYFFFSITSELLHTVIAFSARHCWFCIRKSIRPVKKWLMRCWCGCLSGTNDVHMV